MRGRFAPRHRGAGPSGHRPPFVEPVADLIMPPLMAQVGEYMGYHDNEFDINLSESPGIKGWGSRPLAQFCLPA